MKRINIIKIDSCEATMSNDQDFYQYPEDMKNHTRIQSSGRFIANKDVVSLGNIPVQLIVDHGVEYYIAVKNKVWEYLYLIENPVTAKSQEAKIKKLSIDVDIWYKEADRMGCHLNDLKDNVCRASLWRRIKWVFTGFDYYNELNK